MKVAQDREEDFREEQPSKKKIGHPAPFPVELPTRYTKLFSYVGDRVLDPFLGSGSTVLACRQHARSGIGVEIDQAYCELAAKRVAGVKLADPPVLELTSS
jgi:site-specific DNA-methyltransferase (adenine-specific)